MTDLAGEDKRLFDKYFLDWCNLFMIENDMRAALMPAILSYRAPVNFMRVAIGQNMDLQDVVRLLSSRGISLELMKPIDVLMIKFYEKNKAASLSGEKIMTPLERLQANNKAAAEAKALTEQGVPLPVPGSVKGSPFSTSYGSSIRRSTINRETATASATVEQPAKPVKKGLRERLSSIKMPALPFGKKKDGDSFSASPKPQRFGGGSGFGFTQRTGKSSSGGKSTRIAFVVLAVVILLIVGGVLWRLGNENGKYNSSDNSSASNLGLSACTTADGKLGVIRYNITPNQDIVGLSGFTDTQRNLPYVNSALVFEQGKSYQAIIVGDNYRVGLSTDISVYAPVFSFTQTGSECVQEVAVVVLTSGIESQQRASVQLAYKINFKHWSGLLVVLSLLSILGFTAITLFMSGGKIKDFVLMVVAVGGTAFFTGKSDWEPSTFFMFYVFIYILTVALGSKSELQEQSDSFNAGNQLKLPQSMETLFKSLSRGWGIVGGYDWSQSAIYSALMMFVGAVYPSASPLVRALDSQIMAIGVGALFVVFSCAMEAWRRGLVGDWIAFALGFIGLLDFGIYYSAFGSNPPNLFDFSPSAIAVLGWTATFIVAVLANFGAQATSERTELQRDRMADGMLFFSAMKLVAILGYIFYFLM